MASRHKKGSKRGETARPGSGSPLIDTATEFLDVVEKTGDALALEIKRQFDQLAERVSTLAGAAGETSAALAGQLTRDSTDALRGLLQEVETLGESSARTISEGFDGLRQQFLGVTAQTGAEQGKGVTRPKEKAPKKKGKASNKKASNKKTAAKHKASKPKEMAAP